MNIVIPKKASDHIYIIAYLIFFYNQILHFKMVTLPILSNSLQQRHRLAMPRLAELIHRLHAL